MTAVTNAVNIQDTSVNLSRRTGQDPDFTYPLFTASDANTGFRPTLIFRVSPSVSKGNVELTLTMNGTKIHSINYTSEPVRTMHELLPSGVLKETDNEIVAEATDGLGDVTLSNMVIFYQRTLK